MNGDRWRAQIGVVENNRDRSLPWNRRSDRIESHARYVPRGRGFQRSSVQRPPLIPHRPPFAQNAGYTDRRYYGIDFRHLSNISMMDPNHILLKLSYSKDFQALLDGNPSPNLIVLIVKCLSNISRLSFDDCKNSLLMKAFNSNFSNTLLKYILCLPYASQESKSDNHLFWETPNDFLSDMLDLSESLFDLPRLELDARVFIDVADMCIKGLKKIKTESDEEDPVYDKYQISFSAMRETHRDTNTKLSANDFRRIEIIPTLEELTTRKQLFLRPIIVNGAYPSVQHYLDVQFRLMREDFVSPLREGIIDFIEDPTLRKYSNIRFYRNAKFLKYSFSRDNVGVLVNFDGKWNSSKSFNLRNKMDNQRKMSNSKRFLYGSLLCFTDDNFQNIVFSSVVNRDDLDLGLVTVSLDGLNTTEEMFNKTYLLVESEIYFLPYQHVLKTLKDRSLQKNFPMKRYIIDVEACEVNPKCISTSSVYKYNLPNVDHFHPYQEKIQLLSENWPSPKSLGLDNSQFEAFKMALTREFVTIQGPPGTGKTFLALKVAETLLCNDACVIAHNSPMLIVCYTNHALDQFLEGLLAANIRCLKDDDSLVRIGGQSKSEIMKKYKLNNHRSNNGTFAFRRNLIDLSEALDTLQSTIDFIDSNEGILNVAQFSEYLNFDINRFLQSYVGTRRSAIASWLLMSVENNIPEFSPVDILADMASRENSTEEEESDSVHRPVINADEDLFVSRDHKNFFYVSYLFEQLKRCQIQYDSLVRNKDSTEKDVNTSSFWLNELSRECHIAQRQFQIGNRTLHSSLTVPNRPAESYSCEERWMFYWQWINALKKPLNKALMTKMAKFQSEKNVCDELLMAADYDILCGARVIGITTTGAARQQSLLKALKSRIVIVEEAAEVMESHIIASLTGDCEHLILIGDHLQLKPMTATYRLAKHFNLDLSLFERMVKNGNHCYQLGVQHRMRPEFANLITPAIYPNLSNDPSVTRYLPISGTMKNLYFIDHQFPETSGDEMSSKLNVHECDFLLCLARYFIHHQYKPCDITILVTYTGQMFHMRQEKKYYPELDSVRIINVDNFQGEESKIILLSLVRSNVEAKIGFLSTPNRVCVALSRAKEGFFIIGNMSNLTKSSDIWKQMNETLIKQESIGSTLKLQCKNHTDVITEVKSKHDFDLVPNGGCNRNCSALLTCGHYCKMICHIFDTEHSDYRCMEKCEKSCPSDHRCPLLCVNKCEPCKVSVEKTLPCGHIQNIQCHKDPAEAQCSVTVDVTLPLCGHATTKPCFKDVADVACHIDCIDRLECGHVCTLKCHKNNDPDHMNFVCHMSCTLTNKDCTSDHLCQKQCHETCDTCTIKVTKKRNKCPHSGEVQCFMDINETKCLKDCARSMPCTHFCKQKCYMPCDKCDVKAFKIRSCGHKVTTTCMGDAELVKCPEKCQRLLKCGHPCKGRCSAKCDDNLCQKMVINPFESLCGHKFLIPCNRKQIDTEKASFLMMKYCNENCGHILKGCEHICKGPCGLCFGGRMHMPCQENCGHLLVCGHSCKEPCRESCPPCKQPCEVRCKHSKCSLPCGVPCRPCKMKCERRCIHGKCNKLCGETCDRPPCSEPCKLLLKCKHSCSGLCGELCPPVCKTCDPKSIPELLFGNEDDEDARFIMLVDCPHSVEVNGLDTWVMSGDTDGQKKIAIRACPYCSTPIVNTPRYLDLVRKSLHQIGLVKTRTFGNVKTINKKLADLKTELIALNKESEVMKNVNRWSTLTFHIKDEIQKNMPESKTKKKKFKHEIQISLQAVEKYCTVVNILRRVAAICQESKDALFSHTVMYQINNLIICMQRTRTSLSIQQCEDFTNELLRTERIVQAALMETACKTQVKTGKEEDVKASFAIINDHLFSVKIYTNIIDGAVKEQFEKMKEHINLHLTMKERQTIVAAMGMKPGHWYACPKGHIYCIGDCGGASVESVCPECKAKIGGTGHRLIADNRLAPEMDGAKHSAWSEAANMNNYNMFMN